MKVTKITMHSDGTASREIIEADKSELAYHVLYRAWVDESGKIVRYWTIDEYIKQDPKQTIILLHTIDKHTVEVKAHCIEVRNVYATKSGDNLFNFLYIVNYSSDKLSE